MPHMDSNPFHALADLIPLVLVFGFGLIFGWAAGFAGSEPKDPHKEE